MDIAVLEQLEFPGYNRWNQGVREFESSQTGSQTGLKLLMEHDVNFQNFILSCLPYMIGVFLNPFPFTNLIVEPYWSILNVISRPIADKEKSGRNMKLKDWNLAGAKYQSVTPVQ